MQNQSFETSRTAAKDVAAPYFGKEAAALLAGAATLPANALGGVSHAMKFR